MLLFLGSFGGLGGLSGTLFGIILEVLGVQMGCFFGDFGGLASLGALGAQFAPKPPALFQGRPLFRDFGVQREPKGVPKWSHEIKKSMQKMMRFLRDHYNQGWH